MPAAGGTAVNKAGLDIPLWTENLTTKQVWCFITSKAPLFKALLREGGRERGKRGRKDFNNMTDPFYHLEFLFYDY